MNSDTPRTDAERFRMRSNGQKVVDVDFAETLERELAAVTSRLQTIADEAFGPFATQSSEENATAIERGIYELRDKYFKELDAGIAMALKMISACRVNGMSGHIGGCEKCGCLSGKSCPARAYLASRGDQKAWEVSP